METGGEAARQRQGRSLPLVECAASRGGVVGAAGGRQRQPVPTGGRACGIWR